MIEIHIPDDLGLTRIAESGQCFRWQKDDTGTYQIIHKEHILQIRSLEKNTFALSCSEDDYRNIWHDYFDLGTDYRSIRERISKEDDHFLTEACEYGKGIRILRQDPWEMLISFIISHRRMDPQDSGERVSRRISERKVQSV